MKERFYSMKGAKEMDNKRKTELIFAARSGDIMAANDLMQNGVASDEIYPYISDVPTYNVSTEYNYIFVVKDDNWDSATIELITTDFRKAFDYAYKYSYTLDVWIDGEDQSVIETNIGKDLSSAYISFQNASNTRINDLVEIILPIIKEQKDIYDEEKRKEDDVKNKKIREKELKELARLKAKYETQ